MFKLWHGDCLELMKDIPDGSVDLVLTDPPYGNMKNAPSTWDRSKTAWDTTLDHDKLWREVKRVLRTNGACVLFSQEPYSTELINISDTNLPFCYRMIWEKDTFANHLLAKTAPVSYFEEVLFFRCKKDIQANHDFEGLHPLRPYFADVLDFIGKPKSELMQTVGQRIDHCTRVNSTQFGLCTEATYNELIERYSINKMQGFRQYKDLKVVDTDFKQSQQDERDAYLKQIATDYPVTFNLPQGHKCKSNILKFARDKDGHHPTQKPVALLDDLIRTYSNEGDTVLDFTMGSGSTGVACAKTNRDFIGIELDRDYYDIAVNRINEAKEAVNGDISQE